MGTVQRQEHRLGDIGVLKATGHTQKSPLLSQVLQATRRMDRPLAFAAVVYFVSFLIGWYLQGAQGLLALEMRLGFAQAFSWLYWPFEGISNYILQFFQLTAVVNRPAHELPTLAPVAIVSIVVGVGCMVRLVRVFYITTLPGSIPLVGAFIVGAVGVSDGVGFGLQASTLKGYLEPFIFAPDLFVINLAPILLNLVGEILSTAAGINIAFASVNPERYAVSSRWLSFRMAWKDAARIYVIVGVLLALAAGLRIVSNIPF